MPTMSSDDVFRKALYFRQKVSNITIKHYKQERFVELIEEIFTEIFKDYHPFHRDHAFLDHRVRDTGDTLHDRDSFVNGKDNVRGES